MFAYDVFKMCTFFLGMLNLFIFASTAVIMVWFPELAGIYIYMMLIPFGNGLAGLYILKKVLPKAE